MKLFVALILQISILPSAFATSPLLPISNTNVFASHDRITVEAAIEQAGREGKFVLIETGAAWCGPCARLEHDMDLNQALLAPTLAHFVQVHVEHLFLEGLYGQDFLPYEILYLPTFHLYNPSTGKWSMTGTDSAAHLKESLDEWISNGGYAASEQRNLRQQILAGQSVAEDDIASVIRDLVIEDTAANALAMLTKVLKAQTLNPAQFNFTVDDLESSLNVAYQLGLQNGKLTLPAIHAADPNALIHLNDDEYLMEDIAFRGPIGRMIRTEGDVAAANQCVALAQAADAEFKNFPQVTQDEYKVVHASQCLLLQVQTRQKNRTDVDSFVANLGASADTFAGELMKIYALTGTSFDKAIQYGKLWQASYEKHVAKQPELLARVHKATTARLDAYAAGNTHP